MMPFLSWDDLIQTWSSSFPYSEESVGDVLAFSAGPSISTHCPCSSFIFCCMFIHLAANAMALKVYYFLHGIVWHTQGHQWMACQSLFPCGEVAAYQTQYNLHLHKQCEIYRNWVFICTSSSAHYNNTGKSSTIPCFLNAI